MAMAADGATPVRRRLKSDLESRAFFVSACTIAL